MEGLGLLLGKVDFTSLFVNLSETPAASLAEAKEKGLATLNYGVFINTAFEFLIIAFAIFLVVKQINRMKREAPAAPAAPPEPSNEERLLVEIRDLLKSK